MKIELQKSKILNYNFAAFPTLNVFLDENNTVIPDHLKSEFIEHLNKLSSEFVRYFHTLANIENINASIKNSYVLDIEDLASDDIQIEEQFIDMIVQ